MPVYRFRDLITHEILKFEILYDVEVLLRNVLSSVAGKRTKPHLGLPRPPLYTVADLINTNLLGNRVFQSTLLPTPTRWCYCIVTKLRNEAGLLFVTPYDDEKNDNYWLDTIFMPFRDTMFDIFDFPTITPSVLLVYQSNGQVDEQLETLYTIVEVVTPKSKEVDSFIDDLITLTNTFHLGLRFQRAVYNPWNMTSPGQHYLQSRQTPQRFITLQ